jgi:hypothetical protein
MDKAVGKLIENAPFALVIIGLLLLIVGAAGGWPQPKLEVTEPGWRIALAAMGVIVAAGGGILMWGKRPEATLLDPKKYGFKITSPIDGAKVQMPDVSGTYVESPPPGYVAMIFDFGPKAHTYRPRQRAILTASTKTWTAYTVNIRGEPGEERFLILALVGKAGQALCTYFDEVGKHTDPKNRPPIYTLTPDIIECHRVRIHKA